MNKSDNIKQRLWNIFSAGLPVDYDLEVLRKIFLINLIIFVGGLVLFVFIILEFIIQDYLLGAVNTTIFLFILSLSIYLRKTKNHYFASLIGTTITGFFYIFLITYGGEGNTTYLWSLTYPLIAIFLLGTRLGSVFSLLLLLMAFIFFVSDPKIPFFTSYDIYLKMRYVPAYFTIYLLVFITEKTREITRSRLETAHSEIENTVEKLETTNAALTLNEKRLRQIIDLVPHFIFAKDIDGRFILVKSGRCRSIWHHHSGTCREK